MLESDVIAEISIIEGLFSPLEKLNALLATISSIEI
jgi:hypothetical protein